MKMIENFSNYMETISKWLVNLKLYGNYLKMPEDLLNYIETIWKSYGKDAERMWKGCRNYLEMK